MSRPTRSTRLGRRAVRGAQVVLGVVVAGTLLGPATAGRAQEVPSTLGGVTGRAAASGLHVTYNPDGVLPLPPLVDIGAPDALATIASGPATFARASVLDPGDLLANPSAILSAANPDVPAVPAYPYRIVANSSSTRSDQSAPAPGLSARVEATEKGAIAEANLPGADAPAVATVGSMTAKSTTATDGSTVTVTARTQATGINLLGIITIDSIVTDLVATADGTTTTFEGGTRLTGAKFGTMPITIDGDGVHLEPGTTPILPGLVGQLTGSLNDILAGIGLRVTALPPEELASATAGQRVSTGLRVDFEFSPRTFPQFAALLDALPPLDSPIPGAPSPEDVLALAKARNLASIQLGRGIVELAARPGFAFGDEPSFDPGSPPSFDPGTQSFDIPSAPVVGAPTVGGVTRPVGTATEDTGFPAGSGVGALILLALLAHPFIGERVARFSTAILAGTSSEHCSWEER